MSRIIRIAMCAFMALAVNISASAQTQTCCKKQQQCTKPAATCCKKDSTQKRCMKPAATCCKKDCTQKRCMKPAATCCKKDSTQKRCMKPAATCCKKDSTCRKAEWKSSCDRRRGTLKAAKDSCCIRNSVKLQKK